MRILNKDFTILLTEYNFYALFLTPYNDKGRGMQNDLPPVHAGLQEAQARLQIFGQSICRLGSEAGVHLHAGKLCLCEITEVERRWRRSVTQHIVLFSLDIGNLPQVICRVYDPKLYETALGETLAILSQIGATGVTMRDCSRKSNR